MRKQGLQESGSQGAGTMQRSPPHSQRVGFTHYSAAERLIKPAPRRRHARRPVVLPNLALAAAVSLSPNLATGPAPRLLATRLLPRPPMGVVTERTKARRRPAGPS
jgi:hypothetical protein